MRYEEIKGYQGEKSASATKVSFISYTSVRELYHFFNWMPESLLFD